MYWLILPRVNVEVFSVAMREFAEEVGAGENERVLLVADKVSWHTGGEVPDRVHQEFLPSGSPRSHSRQRGCGP